MRPDFNLIKEWVAPGSRVLDLGCGDGTLLAMLRDEKRVEGLGVEIDADNLTYCISRGVSVVEQDLNEGLDNFRSDSFDVVVMTNSLQTLRYPHRMVDEMLRVGLQCIVTFPNFGHWQARWHLAMRGRMPVSRHLPYTWYDTPNIHFCTVRDFDALCRKKRIEVTARHVVSARHRQTLGVRLWPNLFGLTAIYHMRR